MNEEMVIPTRINLGSGFRKIVGFINIDNREETGPDVCMDVVNGFDFDDNVVDYVRAFDFLEHVPIGKTVFLIEEIYRVLKPGGIFESFTPSTDGRGAFQDPTHVSFWNRNSWLYYMNDEYRALYGIKAKFEGSIETQVTDSFLQIVHDHCVLRAVK